MADNVNATPTEIRNLAKELALGVKRLMEFNDHISTGLGKLAQTFQDEGFAEYEDTINQMQDKLAQIADDELIVAMRGLVDYAEQLEMAESV